MKESKNILHIMVIGLLVVNIVLSAIPLFNITSSSGNLSGQAMSVEDMVIANKEINAYRRELGKNNFKITNDSVYTSSFGSKSIKGIMKNTGTKKFESVSIRFKLYKDNVYVGTADDYLYYSEPGDEYAFDAYVTSDVDFDEYKLVYIMASEE